MGTVNLRIKIKTTQTKIQIRKLVQMIAKTASCIKFILKSRTIRARKIQMRKMIKKALLVIKLTVKQKQAAKTTRNKKTRTVKLLIQDQLLEALRKSQETLRKQKSSFTTKNPTAIKNPTNKKSK